MKKIRAWSLIDSAKGNKYVYDRKLKRTHLCHPLLFQILKLVRAGKDVIEWINHLPDQPIRLNGYGLVSKNDFLYYYQKYLLLKENGYCGEIDQEEKLSLDCSPGKVQRILANLKQVTFEVTDRCGLMCEYCGYGKFYENYDERQNRDLDTGSAKILLDYLLQYWNSPLNTSVDKVTYISFYGGEPLLNMDFIQEIVAYVKALNAPHNRFEFSMTTNALLLEKYCDFLAGNDFNLLISLDGDEHNNAYRVFKNGQPAFPFIIKNVEILEKKYPDYFKKRVDFNAVLHNKNSVADLHHYFRTRFDKIPIIGELNTNGIKESAKTEFKKTYANVYESLMQSEDYSAIEKDMFIRLPQAQDATKFLHHNTDFCFYNYNELIYQNENSCRTPTGTCLPFAKRIFLTVNGKILPCERIGQTHQLGQVTPDRVELDLDYIAQKYNAYYQKMRKQCSLCHNADTCIQCIFNLGTIEEENPVCHGFLNEVDYTESLTAPIDYFENRPETYTKILEEIIVE